MLANNVVAGALLHGTGEVESGSVDDAIDLVLDACDDNAFLSDPFDAFGFAGVDQGYVGAVEGWQILVVEGGSLTELSIPGLQLFAGLRISHSLIHPFAHIVCIFQVDQIRQGRELFCGRWRIELG